MTIMNGSIAGTKKGKVHKLNEAGMPLCGARRLKGLRVHRQLGFFPTHVQTDIGEVNCLKCQDALSGYALFKQRTGNAPMDD